MAPTDKLLLNIEEYSNLLGFLNEKHPEILNEWKSKSAGLAAQTQQTTDADEQFKGPTKKCSEVI